MRDLAAIDRWITREPDEPEATGVCDACRDPLWSGDAEMLDPRNGHRVHAIRWCVFLELAPDDTIHVEHYSAPEGCAQCERSILCMDLYRLDWPDTDPVWLHPDCLVDFVRQAGHMIERESRHDR